MPTLTPALVLYCRYLKRARAFYEALGLVFVAEKHGNGPKHFAADMGGFAIELYPAPSPRVSAPPPHDSALARLVLPVDDLMPITKALAKFGAPMAGPKTSVHGTTVLTADPDGREVLLIESPA